MTTDCGPILRILSRVYFKISDLSTKDYAQVVFSNDELLSSGHPSLNSHLTVYLYPDLYAYSY